ncbi:GtrA family protein [Citreicella sp. 357]|nr:GtrA family protein [Citreicella sp. 357]
MILPAPCVHQLPRFTLRDPPVPQSRHAPKPATRRHLVGFAVAGGLGFATDAGVLMLGTMLGLSPALARLPSFLAAVLVTWGVNRRLTFRTAAAPTLREFLSYLAAMALGLAVNYTAFLAVLSVSDIARALPVLALVPATAAGMVVNFISARHVLNR